MNRIEKEKEIRKLLSLYYEGTATPAEVHRLRIGLETLEPLPDDLALELELLRMVDDAAPLAMAAVDVPDGLEKKLRLDIHRRAAAQRRSAWLRWSGVGVAAAVTAVLMLNVFGGYDDGVDLSQPQQTAQVLKLDTAAGRLADASEEDTARGEDTESCQEPPVTVNGTTFHNVVKASSLKSSNAKLANAGKAAQYASATPTKQECEKLAAAMSQVRGMGKDMHAALSAAICEPVGDVAVSLGDVRAHTVAAAEYDNNDNSSTTILLP